MHLGWHLVAGTTIGLISQGQWIPVMAGMVGIDLVDHGIWGLVKIRPFRIKNIWRTAKNLYEKMEAQLFFFHTLEVYLLTMLLIQSFYWGKWFMLAYSIHLLMDIFWYIKIRRGFDWLKKWSLCWWTLKKFDWV